MIELTVIALVSAGLAAAPFVLFELVLWGWANFQYWWRIIR